MTDQSQQTMRPPPPFVIVQPQEQQLKSYVKRVFGGMACASVVAIAMNFGGVKWGVLTTCKVVLGVFDRHSQPPAVVEEALEKFKGAKGHLPVAGIPGQIHRSPEQIEAIAEQRRAEREREEESERKSLLARGAAAGLDCDADSPLETLRVVVPTAERRRAEEPERKLLAARADKIALVVDPAWDMKTFRGQVKEAEEHVRLDGEYQARHRGWEKAVERWEWERRHGDNARCPACRNAMRIGNPKGQGQCRRCLAMFPRSQAMELWAAPPRPSEPKPGDRKKGLLEGAWKKIVG